MMKLYQFIDFNRLTVKRTFEDPLVSCRSGFLVVTLRICTLIVDYYQSATESFAFLVLSSMFLIYTSLNAVTMGAGFKFSLYKDKHTIFGYTGMP